jgi:hypothetical protein
VSRVVVVGAALVLIPSRAVKRHHRAILVRVQPCMSGDSVAARSCLVTIAFNVINVRACGIAFVGAGAIGGRRSRCGCAWRWYLCAHFTRTAAVFLRMRAACLMLHCCAHGRHARRRRRRTPPHTHTHTHTHTLTATRAWMRLLIPCSIRDAGVWRAWQQVEVLHAGAGPLSLQRA